MCLDHKTGGWGWVGGRPRSELKKTNKKNSQPFFHVVNFKCGTHRSKHRCVFLQTACRPPTCLNQHLFTKYATGLSLPCACQTSSSRCSSVPRPSKTKTRKGGGPSPGKLQVPTWPVGCSSVPRPSKTKIGGRWVGGRPSPGKLQVPTWPAGCSSVPGPSKSAAPGKGTPSAARCSASSATQSSPLWTHGALHSVTEKHTVRYLLAGLGLNSTSAGPWSFGGQTTQFLTYSYLPWDSKAVNLFFTQHHELSR